MLTFSIFTLNGSMNQINGVVIVSDMRCLRRRDGYVKIPFASLEAAARLIEIELRSSI